MLSYEGMGWMAKNGGIFIYGGFGGNNKNWEAVLPNLLLDSTPEVGLYGGGFYHTYRDNTLGGHPWAVFGLNPPTQSAPPVPSPLLTQASIPHKWFYFGSGFPDTVTPVPVNPISPFVGMYGNECDSLSSIGPEVIMSVGSSAQVMDIGSNRGWSVCWKYSTRDTEGPGYVWSDAIFNLRHKWKN